MENCYYHRTTPEAAASILADGFRDGTGTYMTGIELTGVFISDMPLDCNEGCKGDELLLVESSLIHKEIERYEIQEDLKPYREWCVPAELLNANSQVRRVEWDEEVEIGRLRQIDDEPEET